MLRASRLQTKVRRREGYEKSILLSGCEGVEEVNIFLTIQNSDWFKNMLEQSRNSVGYEKESWTTRAMIALKPAGMEGKLFTVNEMAEVLYPYVGPAETRHGPNGLVRRGCKRGIISRTGRKRYAEGTKNPYPEYKIHGHLEIDDCGYFHFVGMCGKPDERDDAGRSTSIRSSSQLRTRQSSNTNS